jgi:energy-coupling factor transport system permease protein
MPRRRRLHPVAWMAWTASATAIGLLTRNPWYLILITCIALVVRWSAMGERPGLNAIRLYGMLMIFPTALNLLFSRSGETVLLELPLRWIGGPYTLEALLFGMTSGVQLASLLAVMSVFIAVVTPVDMLRRIPGTLAPIGLSASIGLTFVPQVRRSLDAIREAQQARGHVPRGWRDLPSWISPLVTVSLENAMASAEGLAARGWGQPARRAWRRRLAGACLLGLALGLVAMGLLPDRLGWGLALTAGSAIGLTLLRGDEAHGRYRPEIWRAADSWVTGAACAALLVILFLVWRVPGSVAYYPYPKAAWPAWEWIPVLGLLALCAPVFGGRRDPN